LVNKDFGHHEVGNDDREDHRVVMVDGVDGFEISVSEGYRRKTFWWLEVDKVEIEIFDGVEMTFSGLVR